MNKLAKTMIGVTAIMGLTACGARVEVPPAHVGKVLTKNGYAPETIPPSKFRLPFCVVACDKLVVLEASDSMMHESLDLFMPKDKLKLQVEVRGTFTVPTDSNTVNALFDRVTSRETDDSDVNLIPATVVYNTYGQQAVRGVVRNELVKYTIEDILGNRDAIGQNIHNAIVKRLADTKTPVQITRFELAKVDPPKVIVAAQEAAKKREIDIQRAEADAEVAMVEAERALEVAKKNRLVEREKAEAIAEQNKIAAQSISEKLLAYRRLEVAENVYTALAQSDNVIIVPADSAGFSDINSDAVFAKMLGKEIK